MARRSRSSPNLLLILAAVALVAVVFGAATVFFSDESKPYRTVPELDVQAYMDNANSLRGNSYRLEAEVVDQLAWSPTSGRLISVSTEDQVVPVLVTPEFNSLNVQKGQGFVFFIEVDEKGILKTKDLTKS